MYSDISIVRDPAPTLMEQKLATIRRIVGKTGRKRINAHLHKMLAGKRFTILCNNCLGGVFYHDAGLRFTSPTVNLAFDGEDFIRFLEDPRKYLSLEIVDSPVSALPYPVGRIDDIEVRFVHYKSFNEAAAKWTERAQRINWEHICVIATDHDGMYRADLLSRFDKIPFPKILFSAKEYPQYDWIVQVPQFKNRNNVKVMTEYADFSGHRWYEKCIDLAQWIINHVAQR